MTLIEYPDRAELMRNLGEQIVKNLAAALDTHGKASIAVPGGSTPGPVFDVLCNSDLDWAKITVLPGDDRWVDENSPHSNAAQIRNRLLVGNAATAEFLPLYSGGNGPEAIPDLLQHVQGHLPLTVALLGMGSDMHTASIFPGEEIDPAAILHYVEMPGLEPFVPRMTLTARVFNDAIAKHIVITGTSKKDALMAAREMNDPLKAPIVSVLSGATVHWAE